MIEIPRQRVNTIIHRCSCKFKNRLAELRTDYARVSVRQLQMQTKRIFIFFAEVRYRYQWIETSSRTRPTSRRNVTRTIKVFKLRFTIVRRIIIGGRCIPVNRLRRKHPGHVSFHALSIIRFPRYAQTSPCCTNLDRFDAFDTGTPVFHFLRIVCATSPTLCTHARYCKSFSEFCPVDIVLYDRNVS